VSKIWATDPSDSVSETGSDAPAGAPLKPMGVGRLIPAKEDDVKIGGIFIINTGMVFRQGARAFHRLKGMASNAQAFAHEAAPHIRKAADFAKKGYAAASESGLIDQYAGRHAGAVHNYAQRGLDGYERLERAARSADGVANQVLR
jgi:hypothetical protein